MSYIHRLLLAALFASFGEAQSASSVTLTPASNPSEYGSPLTLTAMVSPGATGRVTFYDGTAVLGVSQLAAGSATFTTSLLPSGTRQLHAHYSGDTSFKPSNSAVLAQTVAAQASLGLMPPLKYTIAGAKQAAVGDFNGDGKPDLAVTAYPGSPSGSILLGNGDGTFQVISMNLAAYILSIAIGDFNQDGKQDLTFCDQATGRLTVALGNGDGTFGTPATYPLGTFANNPVVVVGDFNGDGISDLAVSLYTNLGIMLGNGDGTFKSIVLYPATNVESLVTGDFNGDGNTDLAAGGAAAMNLSIFLGNGDGTFQAAAPIATPSYPQFLIAADFNQDGKADLAVTAASSNPVYVMLGNGDATFQAPVSYSGGSSVNASLTSGDIDGDGRLDLIVLNLAAKSTTVLFGNGDGTFQAPADFAGGGNDVSLYFAVTGDFNGDGKTDVAEVIGTQVGILLGGEVPDLSISVVPGPGFTQGQMGATYAITVNNPSTLSSSGTVSVIDSLPQGFTATNITGSGWNCTLATLTCTRPDALAPAALYPNITITVNIPPTASGTVIDSATVSGGGDQNSANNTATSSVVLRSLPTVTLTTSPNPSVLGQTVTLTATIPPTTTGIVTFYDGINPLGSAAVAAGQATFATGLLPSGTRSLVAEYGGDSNNGASISPVQVQTVNAVADNGAVVFSSYKVGTSPQYEAVGDFNGDGKLDVITVNMETANTGSASVLLGNGDGTFQNAINSPAGPSPGIVLVGDFNRDGKADAAVVALYGINILLGNGDGTFQSPIAISSSQSDFNGLAVADFNRDGIPDLLGMSNATGEYVFLGKGDGTFGAEIHTSFPVFGWAVADFNGDGTPDLAVLRGLPVSIYLGNGDGTFRAPLTAALAKPNDSPNALVAGDFNGDGKADIAAVYFSGTVGMLLGNGDGTFQTAINSSILTVNYYVVAGDFNGDGKLDLAFNSASLNLTLVFGNGDGTFQLGVPLPTTGSGNIVLGDFNRDGKPDLATSDRGANTVTFLSGAQFSSLSIASTHTGSFYVGQTGAVYQLTVGNPEFQASSGTVSVTDTLPAGFTATAIAGDGWTCVLKTLTCTRSDALLTGGSFPPITVTVNLSSTILPVPVTNSALVSSNSGTSSATDSTAIQSAGVTSLSVVPASSTLGKAVSLTATTAPGETGTVLFLDGMTALGVDTISGGQAHLTTSLLPAGVHQLRAFYGGDTAHASGFSDTTSLVVNTFPDSAFGTAMENPAGASPTSIVLGDFNNDGKADLATANNAGSSVSVLLGNGDGTFRAHADYGLGATPVALAVGDLNGDGNQDLALVNVAVVNQPAATLSVLFGKGDGTFQAAVSIPLSFIPSSVAIGDFNGDGLEDVVIGSASNFTVNVLLGKGDGTFRPLTVTNSVNVGTVLLVADLNGDGKADLLVGNHYFFALLGNGDGTFQSSPWVGYGNESLAAVDFNGDKKTDVVYAVGATPPMLAVQLGTGDGNFVGSQTYPVRFNPSTLIVADVNGDGNADVIGSSNTGDSFVVMLGNGDGTLQSAVYYNTALAPAGMVAGEFNGDARTDLALTEGSAGGVAVMLGDEAAAAPAAFFNGQASLGSNVYYLQFPDSALFGYYNLSYFPILYHYDLGFEAFVDGGNGTAYLYDFTSGHWFYTSPSAFPYLYDFTLNSWLYYFPSSNNPGHYSTNPRYFSNLTTGTIFTM